MRPYNKYLGWELRHHPLSRPEWPHDHLLPLLEQALSPSPAPALRQLFNELEPRARVAGHDQVLDALGRRPAADAGVAVTIVCASPVVAFRYG
ncbi:hypothetical protein ACFVT5_20175 [Streptomyces sp. NPDC058001]|uniref:hypothetical protein n=1 Tax=Streptomyces sp. NPDC058001 TaxID=3346300 RepID=UPI0036EBA042